MIRARPGTFYVTDPTVAATVRKMVESQHQIGLRRPERKKPHGGPASLDVMRWQWKKDHPKQHTWLRNNVQTSPFARGVLRGLINFGEPTAMQQVVLNDIAKED